MRIRMLMILVFVASLSLTGCAAKAYMIESKEGGKGVYANVWVEEATIGDTTIKRNSIFTMIRDILPDNIGGM